MTELSPPPWLQGGTYPALNDRQSFAALIGSEGVVDATTGAGDLRVTERAAGVDMSVDVSSGRGWVLGDSAAFQGYYVVANDATVNLAIAASDATNPRKDIVIAEVRDAFYAGANDDWQLRVVTGTAEATPSEPAVPDTALKLAVVDVAAGASSITNADVTDTRAQATLHVPFVHEVKTRVVSNTGDQGLTTTYADYLATSFTPPGHWGTYRLDAHGYVNLYDTGANISRAVLRIAGADGTEMLRGESEDLKGGPVAHFATGLTGTTTLSIRVRNGSSVGEASSAFLAFTAERTS